MPKAKLEGGYIFVDGNYFLVKGSPVRQSSDSTREWIMKNSGDFCKELQGKTFVEICEDRDWEH